MRRVQIKEAVLGVIDDLSDHRDNPSPSRDEGKGDSVATLRGTSQEEVIHAWRGKTVACVAGRGSLDEAAAAMLGQLLDKEGISARIMPSEAVGPASMFQLDMTDVHVVCLSYLEPGGFTNARYLVRRMRRKLPNVRILVGFWIMTGEETKLQDALRETGADLIVTSLEQAVEAIIATTKSVPRAEKSIQPANEVVREAPAG